MTKVPKLQRTVLRLILEAFVRQSFRDALRARLVCKDFDIEIRRALFTTRILEANEYRFKEGNRRLMTNYVVALARCGVNGSSGSPTLETIHETVEYILKRCPEYQNPKMEFEFTSSLARRLIWKSWQPGSIAKRLHCQKLRSDSGKYNSVKRYCSKKENALAAASFLNIKDLVWTLLDEGTCQVKTYFGSPLACAAARADVTLIKFLLDRLPHSETYQTMVTSAIREAAQHGGPSVLNIFIQERHAQRLVPSYYKAAFDGAVVSGDLELVEEIAGLILKVKVKGFHFEDLPKDLDLYSRVRDRALQLSAKMGYELGVRFALERGAEAHDSINFERGHGGAMLEAVRGGHTTIVQLLENSCAVISAYELQVCLSHAIRCGWISLVKLFLEQMRNIELINLYTDPHCHLIRAVRSGEDTIIKPLLNAKAAQLKPHDQMCRRAYEIAVRNDSRSIAGLLIEYGLFVC